MSKESIVELQKVDCNCNDCKHLLRNVHKQKLYSISHEKLLYDEWFRNRDHELFIAYTLRDKTLLAKTLKQEFKPKRSPFGYGYCKQKEFKEISFIPNTMQLETQECFEHRKP